MTSYQIPVHGVIDYTDQQQRIPLVSYVLLPEKPKVRLWLNHKKIRQLIEDFDLSNAEQRRALITLDMNLFRQSNGHLFRLMDKNKGSLFNLRLSNEEVDAIRSSFDENLQKHILDKRSAWEIVEYPDLDKKHLVYSMLINQMRHCMPQRSFSELCPHHKVLDKFSADRQYFLIDTPFYRNYSYYFSAFEGPGVPAGISQMMTIHTLFTMVEQNLPVFHSDYFYIEDRYYDEEVMEVVEENGMVRQKPRKVRKLQQSVVRKRIEEHPFYYLMQRHHENIVSPFTPLYKRLMLHRTAFDHAIVSIRQSRYYFMYQLYNGGTHIPGSNGFEQIT